MASGYRLGVDLGTTYTAAAIERNGRVEVCTLGDRTTMIPSLALVRSSGEIIVGEAAERRAASEPTAIAREFKRRLGDPAPLVLGGVAVAPEALMAAVLRHVVALVTTREDRPPDQVVLSHPASYGPYKTGLMRRVAELADVADVELVAEPQAAAISYAQRSVIETGRVVAVYDFGGGTFDAALVRRTATGGFDIVGQPEGIERLGGIDLDQLLMEHVLDAAGAGAALDGDADDATLAALVELRDRCQAAKEALSVDPDARVAVNVAGVSTAIKVSRDDLNAMARPRIMETVEALQRAIRNSGLSTGDIDRVLLVGGSSRIPLVADTVRANLHRPVALDANPKTAICEGAALLLTTRPPTVGFTAPPSGAPAAADGGGSSGASPIAPAAAGLAGAGLGAAAAAAAGNGGSGAPSTAGSAAPGPSGSGGTGAPPTAPTSSGSGALGGPGGPPTVPLGPAGAGGSVPPGGPPPPPGFGSSTGAGGGGQPPPGTPSFITPPPPSGPGDPPIPVGPPPERRRRGLLIGIVAAVVVLAIVVAVIALAGGDDEKAATDSTETASTQVTTVETEVTTSPSPTPTETESTSSAETAVPPVTDATTTTIAASVTQVGKTVYFAGFQIDVNTATFTPSEFQGADGELVLDGVATNLTDGNASIGFIGISAPVTLLVDGLSNSISVEGGNTPPGGKGKLTMKATLPSFDPEATVIDFGGTQFNGSTMPLGAGSVTTTAPSTQSPTGSGTSSSGLTVTITGASLQPFSPTANGGGDVAPAEAGQLYLGLPVRLTFSGSIDEGIFTPLLQLPDGTSVSPFDSDTSLIQPGETIDNFFVFPVPAETAGDYVFKFNPARGEVGEAVDIPFTLT